MSSWWSRAIASWLRGKATPKSSIVIDDTCLNLDLRDFYHLLCHHSRWHLIKLQKMAQTRKKCWGKNKKSFAEFFEKLPQNQKIICQVLWEITSKIKRQNKFHLPIFLRIYLKILQKKQISLAKFSESLPHNFTKKQISLAKFSEILPQKCQASLHHTLSRLVVWNPNLTQK